MQVCSVNINAELQKSDYMNSLSFGHGHSLKDSPYSFKEKAIVAGTTALGVGIACAALAKGAGHSLNPFKNIKNIKNSYMGKIHFHEKEVISIGAGSCLGGLIGGYIIDNNKENRKAKRREALMQIGNISIPIITVEAFANIGKKYGNIAKSLMAVAGIFAGVYLANAVMNRVSDFLFKTDKGGRGVALTDFTAHLDDAVVAAEYVSTHPVIHFVARFIPAALMFAGNEVGNKTAQG